MLRGEEHNTAYTCRDGPGARWMRGGTWTHDLGKSARIGLVSMGGSVGSQFTAEFDYVRVYKLRAGERAR
jgi:arabinan endo-1,5-alpha-L-arabinosidase